MTEHTETVEAEIFFESSHGGDFVMLPPGDWVITKYEPGGVWAYKRLGLIETWMRMIRKAMEVNP